MVRNLITAMCLGGLATVSSSTAVPSPLEEARILEQALARRAGHGIFLGQCKLSLPSKIGLVADAADGIKLLKWRCLVIIGKLNEDLARWEADAMHPASEWHPNCAIVIDPPAWQY